MEQASQKWNVDDRKHGTGAEPPCSFPWSLSVTEVTAPALARLCSVKSPPSGRTSSGFDNQGLPATMSVMEFDPSALTDVGALGSIHLLPAAVCLLETDTSLCS